MIVPDVLPEGESVSNWWFLIAFLFSIVGGILAYTQLRKRNNVKARRCLSLGIISLLLNICLSMIV